MSPAYIHGIPCVSCEQDFLETIEGTLDRIRAKAPKDYHRLFGLVFAFVSCEMDDNRTRGQWVPLPPRQEDRNTWGFDLEGAPGLILLNKNLRSDELTGLISHELGHAVVRLEDKWRRGPISDEWQSELAADWYAYKWGFGREIARLRRNRCWMHHGVAPGATFEDFGDGEVFKYRLSRSFVATLIETREAAFTLKWERVGNEARADLNDDEYLRVDLASLGLEKAILAGDCSKDMGFWMYHSNDEPGDNGYSVWRVTHSKQCIEHKCPTWYPVRRPNIDQPGSEVLSISASVRLKDSKDPFIGEYLMVLHRNVGAGGQEGPGLCSVVITWVSAKTGKVYQEEVCSGKQLLNDDGSLLSASTEIVETVEGNGVMIRLDSLNTVGNDSNIQVFYPPKDDSK